MHKMSAICQPFSDLIRYKGQAINKQNYVSKAAILTEHKVKNVTNTIVQSQYLLDLFVFAPETEMVTP